MTKRRPDQFERRERGFYPTPLSAVLPAAHLLKGLHVWEPCAGDGALCEHLVSVGATIRTASDIAPQHESIGRLDALAITPAMADASGATCFVTNPPWPEPRRMGKPTLPILEHLAALRPTWALLPGDFMHNAYARPLMLWCTSIVAVGRVRWIPGSDHDGLDNAAWYRFTMPASGGNCALLTFWPRFRA